MAAEEHTLSFPLNAVGIDTFSEWFDGLELHNVQKSDQLRARLLMEEILLIMQDHYDESVEVTASLDTNFTRQRLSLTTQAGAFNPLENIENELGDWTSSLRTAIGLSPQYSYSWNMNSLRLVLPKKGINPVLKIVLAIVIGVLVGILGTVVFPETIRNTISSVVLEPISSAWISLLGAISAPIIFFTAITTVLNMKNVTDLGRRSSRIVGRYFIVSLALSVVAMMVAAVVFPVESTHSAYTAQSSQQVVHNMLQVIPSNMIHPSLNRIRPSCCYLRLC